MAASQRQPRIEALLRSWKLAHQQMKERRDPDADMIAADIETLESGLPVAESHGVRARQHEPAAKAAISVCRSRS